MGEKKTKSLKALKFEFETIMREKYGNDNKKNQEEERLTKPMTKEELSKLSGKDLSKRLKLLKKKKETLILKQLKELEKQYQEHLKLDKQIYEKEKAKLLKLK